MSPVRVRRALAADLGQAAVEMVAMLPLLAAFGLAVGHVLAAEATRELAGHAAEAAAIAVGRGGNAADAARAALPEWSHERLEVAVRGRQVRVRLEPPAVVPSLGDALATIAAADAGPTPEPSSPPPMTEHDGGQPTSAPSMPAPGLGATGGSDSRPLTELGSAPTKKERAGGETAAASSASVTELGYRPAAAPRGGGKAGRRP